jgi:hypothetical protein
MSLEQLSSNINEMKYMLQELAQKNSIQERAKELRKGKLTKEEVLAAINRKETKLCELVKAGIIIKFEDNFYCEKSVERYFENLKQLNKPKSIDIHKPLIIKK